MSSDSSPYGNPETRQRILSKAWELLEERGSSFRLVDVADAAGVSRQAVYLHFGDRAGLLVALVDHVDEGFGAAKLRAHVFGAPTGVESLRRWVDTMSWYTGKIDRLTQVLEANQYDDEALAAGWRNRMNRRQAMLLAMTERIAGEGRLRAGWSVAAAADLIYAVTMPGPWRELTRHLRWSEQQYSDAVWRLLEAGLLLGSEAGDAEAG